MPTETLASLQTAASNKALKARSHLPGYFVSSMLAGAYVGVGVFLAYIVGSPLVEAGSPWARVMMGASFAVALSLVVFAGAELFTGNAMTMPVGCLRRSASIFEVVHVWVTSWVGNLAGAALLALLLHWSGIFDGAAETALVQSAVAKKMHLGEGVLIARGILCNWLVCLGVWCSFRMKSESGKLIMIFWCLYAFVAAGFEHSVANMTLFSLALLQPHSAAVSLPGMFYNLAWVSLGNIIGGAVFVGCAYNLMSEKDKVTRGANARQH